MHLKARGVIGAISIMCRLIGINLFSLFSQTSELKSNLTLLNWDFLHQEKFHGEMISKHIKNLLHKNKPYLLVLH